MEKYWLKPIYTYTLIQGVQYVHAHIDHFHHIDQISENIPTLNQLMFRKFNALINECIQYGASCHVGPVNASISKYSCKKWTEIGIPCKDKLYVNEHQR